MKINPLENLKYNFFNLNQTKKNIFLNSMNYSERKKFVNLIKDNSNFHAKKNNFEDLIKKLKKIKNTDIPLSRKIDKNSNIHVLNKKIYKIISNIFYFFNFITTEKAEEIINKLIENNDKKKDEKNISIIQLMKMIKKENKNIVSGEKICIEKILEKNGFSKKIKGLKFSKNFPLANAKLEGIEFIDCTFDWTSFNDSDLKNVLFKNCIIQNLSLVDSSISNCCFDECEIRESMFVGTYLDSVIFHQSSLISSSFEDASLKRCTFSKVDLPGTHFFEADVNDSSILKSNLNNTVFFETFHKFKMDEKTKNTAKINRPTTAILIDPQSRGITTPKVFMKLDQEAGTIPIRIHMRPQKTKKNIVNSEVESALSEINLHDKTEVPIPQRLLIKLAASRDSDSAKILKKAEKLASQVDSLFLPGGEDVPPSLYGQQQETKTNWGDDYRRSILELGLIHQSFNKGVPLMAVCRGFQMSNIYFGAQLIQHIDGHKGVQKIGLSTAEKRGLYAEALKNNIAVACFHHQAVSETSPATEHIETAVNYQGLIKASEMDKSGATPMILIQFHPEFYKTETAESMNREIVDRTVNFKISTQNNIFFRILSSSAKAHRIKQTALKKISEFEALDEKISFDRTRVFNEIEKERNAVFDKYIKKHFDWKKGLLIVVKDEPEKFLGRYLKPTLENETDRFFEERETLRATLMHDDNFLISLKNHIHRERILKVIKESDPDFYRELEQANRFNLLV